MSKVPNLIFTFFLSCFYLNLLVAQVSVEGVVLQDADNQPVPFVNIGIPDAGIGTVSGEDGKFILNVPDSLSLLRFSAIGYRTVNLTARSLFEQPIVHLKTQAFTIPTVEITAERLGKDEILGRPVYSRRRAIGLTGGQLGAEVGTQIAIRKPTLLREAHFAIRDRGEDTLLFRVNLYRMEDGIVKNKITPGNIIIESLIEEGEMIVDLSPYHLTVDHDVLLSLEWIKGYRGNKILFKAAAGEKNAAIYFRSASQAPLEKRRKRGGRNLHIGFYLIGNASE